MYPGDEFHGELSSADTTGGVAFTLYDAGSVTERTLGANERLVITSWSASLTGNDGMIVADSDAAGRHVAYIPSGYSSGEIPGGHTCPLGVVPKVIGTQAGQDDVLIRGYIRKG